MSCEHKEIYWYCLLDDRNTCNEDGWYCVDCKKELGFRPDLDKSNIEMKVRNILNDLDDAGIIRVSNGTEGDCIMVNVASKCRQLNLYDKYTIVKLIILDPNIGVDSHAKFWADKAKGVSK